MFSRCDGVDEDSKELQSGRQNAQHAHRCQPDEQDAASAHVTNDGRHVSDLSIKNFSTFLNLKCLFFCIQKD